LIAVAINIAFSPNRSIQIAGRVCDDMGVPLPDVKVVCLVGYDPSWIHFPVPFSSGTTEKYANTTSDSHGNFSLSLYGKYSSLNFLKDGWRVADLQNSPFQISFYSGGFVGDRRNPLIYIMRADGEVNGGKR
jgi:hypothetical protein